MRYLYFILLLFSFLSCKKEENNDQLIDPNDVQLSENQGALILGSFGSEGNSDVLDFFRPDGSGPFSSAVVYHFPDIKSPVGCKVVDSRVRVMKFPAGKYVAKIKNSVGMVEREFEFEIEKGKCNAINLQGRAW